MAAATIKPGFLELYTPKFFTVLKEGYGLTSLKADALCEGAQIRDLS